jgi:phage tail-like protein
LPGLYNGGVRGSFRNPAKWTDSMSQIPTRFSSYNYTVSLAGPSGPTTVLGGFSDVSGLSVVSAAAGAAAGQKHVQKKITGIHKVGDVTLKRGVVDSSGLWNWLSRVRSKEGASQ